MIVVSYNMEMPDECCGCPLFDDEYWFCHGHAAAPAWELTDYRYEGKPSWCPLIEVKNERK